MGARQPSPKREEDKNACSINHPRFGKARLLSNKNGEYLEISLPVVNESEIRSWEKAFKAMISHDCLLLPLSYEFRGTELCGSNGICKINYDNYPYLLREEIRDRIDPNFKYF